MCQQNFGQHLGYFPNVLMKHILDHISNVEVNSILSLIFMRLMKAKYLLKCISGY